MRRPAVLAALAALLLAPAVPLGAPAAAAPTPPAQAAPPPTCAQPLCSARVLATDPDLPWGLVQLPDGTVLYARRDAHTVVALDPVSGAQRVVGAVPGVTGTGGEGGLLGLAVAPTFATDRWLYAMHTAPADARVVRLRVAADGSLDTGSLQVLLSGIERGTIHDGGRLRFGPDGNLWVGTGDAGVREWAQALTGRGALNGKVLRITPDGRVPAGNPFGASPVWSYGHRNPQGLAFDAQGRLWEQEFGDTNLDETNLVVRGGNHGWPQCEGTLSRSGAGCGAPGLVAPKAVYPTSEASCSGIAVVRGVLWAACQRGQRLYRHVISGDALTGTTQHLQGTYGRLRTVEPAADGGLLLTTTNGGGADRVLQLVTQGTPLPGTTTTALASRQSLTGADAVVSPDGRYRLSLAPEGLVLDEAGNAYAGPYRTVLWRTAEAPDRLVLQADGNLVLYAGARALAATRTSGGDPRRLLVQDDGNVVLYGAAGALFEYDLDDPPVLGSGGSLRPGEVMRTDDGRTTLVMQGDGNLVLHRTGGPALWASGTSGSGAGAVVRPDGRLEVRLADGRVLWTSPSQVPAGTGPGAVLALDDGELRVQRPRAGAPPLTTWGSRWATPVVDPGRVLLAGDRRSAADVQAVLQGDGNLVVYRAGRPVFASRTSGGDRLLMQPDGNLVLYDEVAGGLRAVWSTGTAGHPGSRAVVQPDGNLVVYTPAGRPVFSALR